MNGECTRIELRVIENASRSLGIRYLALLLSFTIPMQLLYIACGGVHIGT